MFTRPLDKSFWILETKTRPQNIAAFAVCKDIIEKEELEKRLLKLLPAYKKLNTHRINKKYIIEESIEKYNNSFSNTVSRLMVLDDLQEKSLWNIYLIKCKSSSAILFKLHHSLADGVTGLGFFHNLLFGFESKEKKTFNQINLIKVMVSIFEESKLLLSSRSNNPLETRDRNMYFFSIPILCTKRVLSNKKIGFHVFSIYFASLIFKSIFKKAKDVSFLIPVSLNLKNKVGDLGNYIGASRIKISLENLDNFASIEKQLKSALKKERWYTYYFFSNILYFLSIISLKFARKISDKASRKVDCILTSLSFSKTNVYDKSKLISQEFVIPALMSGQEIAFGFMKTKNYLNVTVILDKNLTLDKNIFSGIINFLNLENIVFID